MSSTALAVSTSVEERLAWSRSVTPYERMCRRSSDFRDPFTLLMFNSIDLIRRAVDRSGSLPNYKPLYSSISGFHSLKIDLDYPNNLRACVEAMSRYEQLAIEALKVLAKGRSRARSIHRIEAFEHVENNLRAAWESLKLMTSIMTPTHLTLQRLFWSQVLTAERSPANDNSDCAAFYEPLYLIRDSYFSHADNEILKEFLSELRALIAHDYYQNDVVKDVPLAVQKEDAARTEALMDELEIAIIMGH